jgi:exopolyphosphatase/guanosine-5'-triphosphate,3'-diphosphate pyrophosphatase
MKHSDMPGFSRQTQEALAVLVRGHRRKFPKSQLAKLPAGTAQTMERLCILLRLAVSLNHSRVDTALPSFNLVASDRYLKITFPEGWLEDHPLSRGNLETTAGYLKAAKFKLRVA